MLPSVSIRGSESHFPMRQPLVFIRISHSNNHLPNTREPVMSHLLHISPKSTSSSPSDVSVFSFSLFSLHTNLHNFSFPVSILTSILPSPRNQSMTQAQQSYRSALSQSNQQRQLVCRRISARGCALCLLVVWMPAWKLYIKKVAIPQYLVLHYTQHYYIIRFSLTRHCILLRRLSVFMI
jgi:hypothetical protein